MPEPFRGRMDTSALASERVSGASARHDRLTPPVRATAAFGASQGGCAERGVPRRRGCRSGSPASASARSALGGATFAESDIALTRQLVVSYRQ